MKKIFLFIMCLSVCVNLIAVKSFNAEQLALRQNIFDFFKEEGYVPDIDSDGDIRFKVEGSSYYVIISETDESPMYLTLYHGFNYGELYTKTKIERVAMEINKYKGVKLITLDNSYSFRIEMYIVNAEHFRYTFYKHMKQIKNAQDELRALINE